MTKRLKIGQIARAICLLTQKWLDATHRASHNRKVMKKKHIMFLSAAAMLGLCACEDETAPASTSVATEPAKQEVTTPPAEVKPDAQKALFEALLYDLGKQASENASHPELNESVRNMLALAEEYYTRNAEATTGTVEKARLALHLANITRDLTAWERACNSYDRARGDYDALPEAERSKPEVRRMLSAICNGKAFCLMNQRKTAEATELYTQALDIDSALYELVAPPEGEALPEGEVEPNLARAAEDVFFSYRCLGECQEAAGDPEEARETLKLGLDLAKRLDRLSPGMSLQYVRLLGAIGNLESRCGNKRAALTYWVQAAQICRMLNQSTPNLIIRSKTARQFQSLLPQIKALQEELNPDAAAPAEASLDAPITAPEAAPAEAPALP